jgi:hypothetical protein
MAGHVDSEREQQIARVLRPLATSPMTRKQAELAGHYRADVTALAGSLHGSLPMPRLVKSMAFG